MNRKKSLIIISLIVILVSAIVGIVFAFDKETTYTVSFETDGGSVVKSQIVKEGDKVIKPEDPIKDGYMFVEWIYDGVTYDFSMEVNSDLTLLANWIELEDDIEKFIVKFDSDGGTTISNQVVEKGDKIKKPNDPVKDGYTFKGWFLEDSNYNFEMVIDKNIELKAKWEKNSVASNNTKKPNNSSSNNQQIENTNNQVHLATPTITKGQYGSDGNGTVGMELKVNSTDGITGIEIYSSTTENGTYTLQKTVKKEDWNNTTSTVYAQKGQHIYFKVRTYVKNSAGTFYSVYSNVLELNNQMSIPTITRGGYGASSLEGDIGMEIVLNSTEGITGVELYTSTSENGEYKLATTVTKENLQNGNVIMVMASKGQRIYFKVRTYVKNSAGTFYSGYSNVLELNNTN